MPQERTTMNHLDFAAFLALPLSSQSAALTVWSMQNQIAKETGAHWSVGTFQNKRTGLRGIIVSKGDHHMRLVESPDGNHMCVTGAAGSIEASLAAAIVAERFGHSHIALTDLAD
jgi:hypothetical protein